MTTRITKPQHSLTLKSYEELNALVQAFAEGKLNLVILVGTAGVAKSQTVRNRLGGRSCWIEGNATSFGIYQKLYQHRNQPVVIDDVDSLYSDKAAVRMLKCVCQTDSIKSVAWNSASASLAAEGIPRSFETTSRLMIIANDWKTLDANVAAVQDRGHLVFFEPTPEEVHLHVANWFWDQQIFNWFADHLHLISEPSMRLYIRASGLKESGLDWVKALLSNTIPEKALLVARLKGDPRFTEERDRVREFTRLGGGGQTTWYKWSKRIRNPGGISHLKVPLQHQRNAA